MEVDGWLEGKVVMVGSGVNHGGELLSALVDVMYFVTCHR
jgi:hypothetical protein